MHHTRLDGQAAVDLANAFSSTTWKLYQYEPYQRNLALSLKVMGRDGISAFLVCHGVSYVDSRFWLERCRLLAGEEAEAWAAVNLENRDRWKGHVLVLDASGGQSCIISDSYCLYQPGDPEGLLFSQHWRDALEAEGPVPSCAEDLDAPESDPNRLPRCWRSRQQFARWRENFELKTRLHLLQGCNLEFRGMGDVHQPVLLQATDLGESVIVLLFLHVTRIKIAHAMPRANLRLPRESDQVGTLSHMSHEVPEVLADWKRLIEQHPQAEMAVIVESNDGSFYVESVHSYVCQLPEPEAERAARLTEIMNQYGVTAPLWRGGPPLCEL